MVRAVIDIPVAAGALQAALEGLVALDCWVLEHRPELPSILDGGVRYQRERRPNPRMPEHWKRVDQVHADEVGDCEDLVAALVAELRVRRGRRARAIVVPDPNRPNGFHALVEDEDGAIIDPSFLLGMNGGPQHEDRIQR